MCSGSFSISNCNAFADLHHYNMHNSDSWVSIPWVIITVPSLCSLQVCSSASGNSWGEINPSGKGLSEPTLGFFGSLLLDFPVSFLVVLFPQCGLRGLCPTSYESVRRKAILRSRSDNSLSSFSQDSQDLLLGETDLIFMLISICKVYDINQKSINSQSHLL